MNNFALGKYMPLNSPIHRMDPVSYTHLHAPYDLGYTRTTIADTTRSKTVMWSKTQKVRLSSD